MKLQYIKKKMKKSRHCPKSENNNSDLATIMKDKTFVKKNRLNIILIFVRNTIKCETSH